MPNEGIQCVSCLDEISSIWQHFCWRLETAWLIRMHSSICAHEWRVSGLFMCVCVCFNLKIDSFHSNLLIIIHHFRHIIGAAVSSCLLQLNVFQFVHSLVSKLCSYFVISATTTSCLFYRSPHKSVLRVCCSHSTYISSLNFTRTHMYHNTAAYKYSKWTMFFHRVRFSVSSTWTIRAHTNIHTIRTVHSLTRAQTQTPAQKQTMTKDIFVHRRCIAHDLNANKEKIKWNELKKTTHTHIKHIKIPTNGTYISLF